MTDLAMIVAVARNNVIGQNNQLPWHIPEDLKWFKEKTMGKPMIMGRKTFESFPKPLPGRTHIVISKSRSFAHDSVVNVTSLEDAISAGERIARESGAPEIMIIGGGTIYAKALTKVNKIYRTLIDLEPPGDTYFPELGDDWAVSFEEARQHESVKFFFQTVEKAA